MIEISCPNCGTVMAVFQESELARNKAIRRAYEHLLRNSVLCGNCHTWVQQPAGLESYEEAEALD